ncbi:MAG: prenyltransferase [Vulcanimicrobiaceae bacterium]
MRTLGSLWQLARPTFLLGGLVGGALGGAMAALLLGRFDWRTAALAQVAISGFHLMTHVANDYFDREGDALAQRTPFSGGSGVLVAGELAPVVALRAALCAATPAALACLALAALGRPLACALGLLLGALAWAYSAPPFRLLARGLGELDTALIVGTLFPLCAYAAQGAPLGPPALASTLPGAAAIFAMMIAVELPDLEPDAACGKRNLLVRLGWARTRTLAFAALAALYLGVALAVAAGAPRSLALLEALTLPLSFGMARALARSSPASARNVLGALAGRGVGLYFLAVWCAMLAYATPALALLLAR